MSDLLQQTTEVQQTTQAPEERPTFPFSNDPVPKVAGFALVLLPGTDGKPPEDEDHYPISDPFYSCCELPDCHCLVDLFGHVTPVRSIMPGREFHGRLARMSSRPLADDQDEWTGNLRRAADILPGISAYAVITPDGLWLQTSHPEPQDLIVEGGEVWPPSGDVLTAAQVAWRKVLAELVRRYEDFWVLGCAAYLSFQLPRRGCVYA